MRTWAFVVGSILLAGWTSWSGWASEGQDVTSEYQSRTSSVRAQGAELDRAALQDYDIILVPGIATDLTRDMGKLTGELGITPSKGFLAAFDQPMTWMTENEIPYSMAPINREGSCAGNGQIIADSIAQAGKKVILVTQSKAGVDALLGLMDRPETRSKVAGWVAYQPLFMGSPVADEVRDHAALRLPTDLLIRLLSGTALSYEDMQTSARQSYNREHAAEIERIASEIPLVELITTEQGSGLEAYLFGKKSEVALLSPLVNVIAERGGGPNDGLAMVNGTCLKNASCVFLSGIDHFASGMDTAPYKTLTRDERVTLFRTLLQMVLSRINGRH